MSRIFLLNIITLIVAMALFCQCSKTDNNSADGYGSKYPKTKEAYAIIDSCMSFMETDPARSHHVIDSVCNAKLMSPLRCKYLHATVVFGGDNKPRRWTTSSHAAVSRTNPPSADSSRQYTA